MIDFSSGFPHTAASRLLGEHIVWLTTVDSAGAPQPRPVWFHFDGAVVLVFSQPWAGKVRHIRLHPAVSVHLNSDFKANRATVFLGEARILDDWPAGPRLDEYIEKYRQGIQDIGFTPESFLAEYSTAIEVALTQARGI